MDEMHRTSEPEVCGECGAAAASSRFDPASPAGKALREAVEWRLLGLLFERPRPAWRDAVTALAAEVQDPALASAAAAASPATESDYLGAFGPGGAVSPREVAYRGREDPGGIVADVRAFYAAFAFHPFSEDPPDHLAVEANFVGYLCLKEAYALAQADPEAAQTCAEARSRFIIAHLRYAAEPLAAKLENLYPLPHLLLAGLALRQRTGPSPADLAGVASNDGDGDGFDCDGCPGTAAHRPGP